jgi:hypothetical protein
MTIQSEGRAWPYMTMIFGMMAVAFFSTRFCQKELSPEEKEELRIAEKRMRIERAYQCIRNLELVVQSHAIPGDYRKWIGDARRRCWED